MDSAVSRNPLRFLIQDGFSDQRVKTLRKRYLSVNYVSTRRLQAAASALSVLQETIWHKDAIV